MRRNEMADLTAFYVVAEEKSFTRAARRLGVSQSSLSQIVRRLEARLGVRLLARTTRSVAPTESGERILTTLGPMLRDLDASIASLSEFMDRPSGVIRINSVEHAARTVLQPALGKLLAGNPDLKIEIVVDYGLVDIVAERFDAGVRLGGDIDKDMIAVRISADIPMAVIGAPAYFRERPAPSRPEELIKHRCINLRLPTSESFYRWNFVKRSDAMKVQVDGPLSFNSIDMIRDAALAGLGLAYLPLDYVDAHIRRRRLIRILDSATPPLPGYHLYYPNRRFASPAFKLLVETLKYRPPS